MINTRHIQYWYKQNSKVKQTNKKNQYIFEVINPRSHNASSEMHNEVHLFQSVSGVVSSFNSNWDLKTNFSALKVRLLALAVSNRVITAASWGISALPWHRTSSTIPVLGKLFRTLSSLSWNTSPARVNPKGRQSQWYLPHGVLKFVSQ